MIISLLIFSFFISALGNLIGFGGGIFLVPLMISFYQFSVYEAIGIASISLCFGAFISTVFNWRRKLIQVDLALKFILPTMLGSFLGSYSTSIIPDQIVRMIFIALLILLAYKNLAAKTKANRLRFSRNLLINMTGVVAGLFAGLLGIGGGFIKTPVLISLFKLPPKKATATSLTLIFFTSCISSATHLHLGHMQLTKSLPIIIAFGLGSIASNLLNKKIKNESIQKLVSIFLIIIALWLTIQALL
jgi:uncharacterized membrane protein YfcA